MNETSEWPGWQAFARSGGWARLSGRRIEAAGDDCYQVLSDGVPVARIRPLATEPTPGSPGFSEWLSSVDC